MNSKNSSENKDNLSVFIKGLNNENIVRLYGLWLEELKERGIIRSNNIVGDLGEYLAIEHYNDTPGLPNLQAAPPGTQNVDALSRKGNRYSIKTITGRVTGVFYGLPPKESDEEPTKKFEYVIVVKLNKKYQPEKIIELTWQEFLENKRWHSRMRAWNISLTNELISKSRLIFDNS